MAFHLTNEDTNQTILKSRWIHLYMGKHDNMKKRQLLGSNVKYPTEARGTGVL